MNHSSVLSYGEKHFAENKHWQTLVMVDQDSRGLAENPNIDLGDTDATDIKE